MKDGIYFDVFAFKDGFRYHIKTINVADVSKIFTHSVMDGLEKVISFDENDHPTEKGGE